jgi:hypothetical protein
VADGDLETKLTVIFSEIDPKKPANGRTRYEGEKSSRRKVVLGRISIRRRGPVPTVAAEGRGAVPR